MDSMELVFDLREVAALAEHAMSAPEHSWPDWDDDKPSPVPPSLVWVKDQGTYVMSNGIPRELARPDDPRSPARVAYARGYDGNSGARFDSTPVGGDDFAEHLPLTVDYGSPEAPMTLIELIRHHATRGTTMTITVTSRTMSISFDSQPDPATT
ncbi:DUF3085 domain-containing protein [Nocardia thailandica]